MCLRYFFRVRGTGGGKTRLLEEIRRRLNNEKDTVAIAITFNAHSEYPHSGEIYVEGPEYWSMNIMLAMLTRIAVVVYGGESIKMIRIIRDNIHELNLEGYKGSTCLSELSTLARVFLQHFMLDLDSSVKAGSGGKERLEKFVILVDEVMVFDDRLSRSNGYGHGTYTISDFKNALAAIQEAVLDLEFTGTDGGPIKTALVISSLNALAIGVTDSGRSIQPLLIAENLDSSEIVSSWWLPGVKVPKKAFPLTVKNLSSLDLFRLDLVAKSINSMPRMVESALPAIQNIFDNAVNLGIPLDGTVNLIDAEAIEAIYKELLDALKSCYPASFFDSEASYNQLYALVYGDAIELGLSGTETMIKKSVLTNSMRAFDKESKIIPQASVIMMAHQARFGWGGTTLDLFDFLHCFYQLFHNFVDTIKLSNAKGDTPLEMRAVTTSWMQCRLAAAVNKKLTSIDLRTLLGVPLAGFDRINILLPSYEKYFVSKTSSSALSNQNAPTIFQYARKLNEETKKLIQLWSPFVMHESVDGQKYDFMLACVMDVNISNNGFVVFTSSKSADISPDSINSTKTFKYSQFEWVLKVAKKLTDMKTRGGVMSPAAEALVQGNFVFIYITTFPDVNVLPRYKNNKNIVIMREAEAKAFFGMNWEFYKAARTPVAL